ncbi:sugar-binding transcriptional regulator [Paenibacillus crassostreae]|uniref:Transcriptional regulator n=1 Tax=Paenibacillus crassostreae TaxID=1763538 RepID=A0A167ANK3_9BACL|nr:sugar-binding transcriptional regulator [Paenibacillus crassostreae]AOZ93712.1 transcriptional regulator [Paenibacillus crassostreae]OAB71247.1 transcriptional regulator [Paenibacillus crassostreae]
MLNTDDKKMIIKICKLYYYESWTQEKIAEKFNVSRPFISKMIQKAREVGIVEILVHDDSHQTYELEKGIEQMFNLKQVLVVPTRDLNNELVTSAVGKAAAQFVQKLIKDGDRIGVSWGNTLYHMVREFPLEKKGNVKVVPLVGGTGNERTEIHSNQIAYEMAKKLGGKCESLYAPSIVETEQLKEQIVRLPNIASVLAEGEKVDLAIVGIGNPYSMSTMERFGYLTEEVLDELKELDVVADINSRFINREGHMVSHSINNKVIGIGLESLKQTNNVVGLAFGLHKIDCIKATLKGGYIQMLVTDEATANKVINDR